MLPDSPLDYQSDHVCQAEKYERMGIAGIQCGWIMVMLDYSKTTLREARLEMGMDGLCRRYGYLVYTILYYYYPQFTGQSEEISPYPLVPESKQGENR